MNWNIKSPSNIVRERLEANFSFDDRIILERCQLSLDSQYVKSNPSIPECAWIQTSDVLKAVNQLTIQQQ
jgi:hypothetical protein